MAAAKKAPKKGAKPSPLKGAKGSFADNLKMALAK